MKIFDIIVENEFGEILSLTDNFNKFVTTYSGMNPPNASVSSDNFYGLDGVNISYMNVKERNVVLTIHITADNVPKYRTLLYKFFKPYHKCKLYFSNAFKNIYIEGYPESIECDQFTNDEQVVASIICPEPYLLDQGETILNGNITKTEQYNIFVDYDGEVTTDTECIMEVQKTTEFQNSYNSYLSGFSDSIKNLVVEHANMARLVERDLITVDDGTYYADFNEYKDSTSNFAGSKQSQLNDTQLQAAFNIYKLRNSYGITDPVIHNFDETNVDESLNGSYSFNMEYRFIPGDKIVISSKPYTKKVRYYPDVT